MSSKKSTFVEDKAFTERFIEVCGSSQPAEIARLLDISYQAAKNYLLGRVPESGVLKTIAERTAYSIHWLLTGKGKKFVSEARTEDTPLLGDQVLALIKEECRKNVAELLNQSPFTAHEKIITVNSEDIKDEKVIEKANSLKT